MDGRVQGLVREDLTNSLPPVGGGRVRHTVKSLSTCAMSGDQREGQGSRGLDEKPSSCGRRQSSSYGEDSLDLC